MKKDNIKTKEPITEQQLNEFVASIVKWIFGKKAKAVMQVAAKNPKFKTALEKYAKETKTFRKELDDLGLNDTSTIKSI